MWPQDYPEGVKWYRKAAEQGYATAQFSLAYRYLYGHGVPQDYVLAHVYCNLAASNGSGERDQRAEAREDHVQKS